MNPRVSRSSALASKATGFPIARSRRSLRWISPRRDPNDITRLTPASFEPTIDYIVVKVPRWAFEKFPARRPDPDHADEVGRGSDGDRPDLQGSLHEGFPLPGTGIGGLLFTQPKKAGGLTEEEERARCSVSSACRPTAGCGRCFARSIAAGRSRICTSSRRSILVPHAVLAAGRVGQVGGAGRSARDVGRDAPDPEARRHRRRRARRDPRRRRRCGAFDPAGAGPDRPTSASTPAPPSSSRSRRTVWQLRARVRGDPTPRSKVVILGSGPNRIGQGIEFDYCCCHAAFALREEATDGDGQLQPRDRLDRLRHGGPPLFRAADVRGRLVDHRANRRPAATWRGRQRRPDAAQAGVAAPGAGIKILGTSPDSIDLAEIASDSRSCSGISASRKPPAASPPPR